MLKLSKGIKILNQVYSVKDNKVSMQKNVHSFKTSKQHYFNITYNY